MLENFHIDADFDAAGCTSASAHGNSQAIIAQEHRLWCAVIAQAFADAGIGADAAPASRQESGTPNRYEKRRLEASQEALDWLLHDVESFIPVCTMAGVSPAVIRTMARKSTGIQAVSV